VKADIDDFTSLHHRFKPGENESRLVAIDDLRLTIDDFYLAILASFVRDLYHRIDD
jgi:hypothetical protein